MRRMIQRVSVLFIAFTMLMVCFPLKVQAQVESEALLFINEELYIGSAEKAYKFDKNGMEKYTEQRDKWEINGNTLTLNGFSFETTSGLGLVVADGGIIELAADSVNTIKTSGTIYGLNIQVYGKSYTIQGKGTLNTYGSGDDGSSIDSIGWLTLKDCKLNINSVNNLYSYVIIASSNINCDNVEINMYIQDRSKTERVIGIYAQGAIYIKDSFVDIIFCNNLISDIKAVMPKDRLHIKNSILNIQGLGTPIDYGFFYKENENFENSHVSVKNALVALGTFGAPIIAPDATVTGAIEEFLSGVTTQLTQKNSENPVIVDNKTFNFTGGTANGITEEETQQNYN